MKLKCLVIDDEPLAVELITAYVNKTPFLEFVGSFNSATEALEFLRENSVDLIFCDIQMPDLNGIEFSRMITKDIKVIFTTAFNQYAIEGFRVNAVDYLLKPIRYSDFLTAANKCFELVSLIRNSAKTLGIESENEPIRLEIIGDSTPSDQVNSSNAQISDSIFVKSDYQLRRINIAEILYVEGLKDYVKIFIENDSMPIISNLSLKSLEERLPFEKFMRIHRSYIVQLSKIKVIERNRIIFGSTYIPIAESCKEEFYSKL